MKESFFRLILLLFVGLGLLISCEGGGEGPKGPGGEAILSQMFDVSGAQAVVMAGAQDGGQGQGNDILKMTAKGNFESIIKSINGHWHMRISVLELGPDGSLYIGLDWGIWVRVDSSNFAGEVPDFAHSPAGRNVAFFQITPQGKTYVVDHEIEGIAKFWGDEDFPKKPVQFDRVGNLYYLGRQGDTSILRKRKLDGSVVTIGHPKMEVRNFIVAPNGTVYFRGRNRDGDDGDWLRALNPDGSITNILYNEGGPSLRSYFLDAAGDLILVGENLEIIGTPTVGVSGIVKVRLDKSQIQDSDILYRDDFLYWEEDEAGGLLVHGFWNGGRQVNFLQRDQDDQIVLPTRLREDVDIEAVRTVVSQLYREDDLVHSGLADFNPEGLVEERIPRVIEENLFLSILEQVEVSEKNLLQEVYEAPGIYADSYRLKYGWGVGFQDKPTVVAIFSRLWKAGTIDLSYSDRVRTSGLSEIELVRTLREVIQEEITALLPPEIESWGQWRMDNQLSGMRFSHAKRIFNSPDGAVYATIEYIINGQNRDRLFQITDSEGEAQVKEYELPDNSGKLTNAVASYEQIFYILRKNAESFIYAVARDDEQAEPINLMEDRRAEIFGLVYYPDRDTILYDVYDLDENSTYLVTRKLRLNETQRENPLGSMTILDYVPYEVY